jgi:mRNA-degrading endonuclease RelE of RelBE toxin-antitoxin system
MAWTIELAPTAKRQLAALPRDHQEQITRTIEWMSENPFAGDVKLLKGSAWKGRYRKRVGRYRLIFIPYHEQQLVEISAILLRSEKTYR